MESAGKAWPSLSGKGQCSQAALGAYTPSVVPPAVCTVLLDAWSNHAEEMVPARSNHTAATQANLLSYPTQADHPYLSAVAGD